MINEVWAIVAVIGVWGWILAGVGFTFRAFPARDRFNGRCAAIWGGCFIFFYALWIAGMIKA
jgi:hypothetical protein